MLIVTVGSKVLLEDCIDSFNLVISLRMEVSRELQLDIKEFTEVSGKLRSELDTSISDNRVWEAI